LTAARSKDSMTLILFTSYFQMKGIITCDIKVEDLCI
jgi:hypothetical protein